MKDFRKVLKGIDELIIVTEGPADRREGRADRGHKGPQAFVKRGPTVRAPFRRGPARTTTHLTG